MGAAGGGAAHSASSLLHALSAPDDGAVLLSPQVCIATSVSRRCRHHQASGAG